MTDLAALLLPILLSSILVFIVSAVIHMAPLWHRNEFPRLAAEDQVRAALRPLALAPGEYMMPRAHDQKDMASPEFIQKVKEGPNMILTVLPNQPFNMPRTLGIWFVYVVLVSVFAAYVAGRALLPGSAYLDVFCLAGTTAFLAYAVALWQDSIWFGRPWSVTAKTTLDGLIYALVTAGVFGWLWPMGR